MNVLSCFDGISCGQVALERIGINPSIYYASEIDQNAIKVTQSNYPKTVQMGDIKHVCNLAQKGLFSNIDLVMGGSPCQGFSRGGANLGFKDARSQLLFEFVSIVAAIKPRWFLLENVRMKPEDYAIVSALLGVQPVEIDSSLFSAQRRKRAYWTNIPIAQIIDKGIEFWMIREYSGQHLKSYKLNRTPSRERMWADGKGTGGNKTCGNVTFAKKSYTLTTVQDRFSNGGLIAFEDFCRYLTHSECERLQTLPEGYTKMIKSRERYKAIGNGWTVDVIAHILKGMLK